MWAGNGGNNFDSWLELLRLEFKRLALPGYMLSKEAQYVVGCLGR